MSKNTASPIIGERERANLVVQLARFFYIYIYFWLGERERANLVVQLARFFAVRRDVALMPYVLPISKYTTILSCNVLRTSKYTSNEILHHAAQRVLVGGSGYAFMPAFMQAACRLYTCSCRLLTPSCSMSMHSCRLPVLSDLLLWSGTFSTHCTDANRRETMPKQHYITCLAQCVPTLHPPSGLSQLLHHFIAVH